MKHKRKLSIGNGIKNENLVRLYVFGCSSRNGFKKLPPVRRVHSRVGRIIWIMMDARVIIWWIVGRVSITTIVSWISVVSRLGSGQIFLSFTFFQVILESFAFFVFDWSWCEWKWGRLSTWSGNCWRDSSQSNEGEQDCLWKDTKNHSDQKSSIFFLLWISFFHFFKITTKKFTITYKFHFVLYFGSCRSFF